MARVSIYISDDLKSRMDAAGDAINWSEVARPAFLSALATHEHRMSKTMTTAIERLRASKAQWLVKTEGSGKQEGREWAENIAEYEDLVALSRVDLSDIDADDDDEAWEAFSNAMDPDNERVEWVHSFFPSRNGRHVYAFIDGVQEFFAEVNRQL